MKLTKHLSTLLVFVFLLLQNPLSFAQFGMERGAIITLQGDTLVGKIKSASLRQLSRKVTFQSEDSKTTYRADEIQGFFFRDGMESVQRAAQCKYILLNTPNEAIPEIAKKLPGAKSPTILPLAMEGWSSLHSVVQEEQFWEVIDELKQLGAEGILVIPIEKMIL